MARRAVGGSGRVTGPDDSKPPKPTVEYDPKEKPAKLSGNSAKSVKSAINKQSPKGSKAGGNIGKMVGSLKGKDKPALSAAKQNDALVSAMANKYRGTDDFKMQQKQNYAKAGKTVPGSKPIAGSQSKSGKTTTVQASTRTKGSKPAPKNSKPASFGSAKGGSSSAKSSAAPSRSSRSSSPSRGGGRSSAGTKPAATRTKPAPPASTRSNSTSGGGRAAAAKPTRRANRSTAKPAPKASVTLSSPAMQREVPGTGAGSSLSRGGRSAAKSNPKAGEKASRGRSIARPGIMTKKNMAAKKAREQEAEGRAINRRNAAKDPRAELNRRSRKK